MSQELLIYTIRPDGTAIWLPEIVATSMGLQWGSRISRELYDGREIQGLIARRLSSERKGGR